MIMALVLIVAAECDKNVLDTEVRLSFARFGYMI